MSKVVVIGAGASGIIASLKARENNEVILLDSNNKLGKKILITGNGKCNYFNTDININNYNTDSIDSLKSILNNKDIVLEYLSDLGIYPKIKNGYYYPNSNQASSVVEVFNNNINKSNIKVIYECKVNDIIKSDDSFIIKSNLDDIICDKVIIACGGCSYPKTGSDGSIFNIINKYHTVNSLLPSLVPLKLDFKYLKDWNNLRVDAKVELYINNNYIDSEIGEVQLTDYGISGIPVFNLSGKIVKNVKENVELKIDFLSDISDLKSFLIDRNKDNRTIENILETVLPYQLIDVLLRNINIDKNSYLDDNNVLLVVEGIKNFKVRVIDYLDFDRSQVTSGGVSLKEINPNTLESLKVKDLYLVGEVLDVDGKCGGFNLGFAFISGYLAGKSV